MHDRALKNAFLSSEYADGLDLSLRSKTPFHVWVNQKADGPITNFLRLALFIFELRGLP